MILIADSGSTKTEWCLIDKGVVVKQMTTSGINPYYQNESDIINDLQFSLFREMKDDSIESIYFYGAGCAFPDKQLVVKNAIQHFFAISEIQVNSDLLGAARSLFGRNKGIACILGTGSNSCFYDGKDIVENVSPLGYILGDEGSGAVLGKLLIADCLKNQLPEWLRDKLLDEYELTPALVLENVYKKPFPNRFLAKLTPFLAEHIEEPAIFNLVYDSFDAFFVRNVMQYNLEEMEVGFVGSVAFHFADTLEIVASERAIPLHQIVQSPMQGLIAFHF